MRHALWPHERFHTNKIMASETSTPNNNILASDKPNRLDFIVRGVDGIEKPVVIKIPSTSNALVLHREVRRATPGSSLLTDSPPLLDPTASRVGR